MTRSFPDALVPGYESLVDGMTNDPKDRHVLAAAVRANAEVIVTFNRRDFPESALSRTTSKLSTLTSSCSTNSTSTPA
jgi:predicted nucleic acid-binding protein